MAIAAIALYSIIGFLVVPYVVRTQVPKQTVKLLGAEARLAKVNVNPFTFEATLSGFELDEPEGGKLIGFDRVYANIRFLSLLTGTIEASQILVENPSVNAVLEEDGSLNLLKIIPEADDKPDEEPGELPKIIVRDFQVTGASITATDKARGFSTMIAPLNLSVTNFATISNQVARIEVDAGTGFGETFKLGVDASVVPLDVKGSVALSGVDAANYLPFVRPLFTGELANEAFEFSIGFAASMDESGIKASVADGSVAVRGVAIREAHGADPLVQLGSFAVSGITASYPELAVEISRVALDSGGADVVLNEDKQLNLLGLVDLGESGGEPEEPSSEPGEPLPLSIALGEFSITGFRIETENRLLPDPAAIAITVNDVNLKSVAFPPTNPVAFAADLTVGEGGGIKASGPIDLEQLQTRIEYELTDIDLTLGQRYLEPMLNIAIRDGVLGTSGSIEVEMKEGEVLPSVHLTSDVRVSRLNVEAVDPAAPVIQIESVDVSGIDANLDPMSVVIEEIRYVGGKKHFVIGEDGRMNLAGLVKQDAAKESEPVAADPAEQGPMNLPPVQVKRIVVENAEVEFTDELFDPPFKMLVREVGGEITNVNTNPDEQLSIGMKGIVGDAGRFEVDGTALPLNENRQADVRLSMNGFGLSPVSSYSGKFIGYPVDRGSLSVAVRYQIADQNLNGDNSITVRNLELGNRISGSDAPNLPIKLAIKLLQDSNSEINLDVPISGRIDDPSFQLSAVIADSFAGIITKVATSPFTLLGSLVGGGDDDLSKIEFAAGETELDSDAQKALDKLAKALAKRPVLQLEVPTVLPGGEDRSILMAAAFEESLNDKLASIQGAGAWPLDQKIARAYAMEFGLPEAVGAPEGEVAMPTAEAVESAEPIEQSVDEESSDGEVSTRPKTRLGRFWYEGVLGWRFEEPLVDEPSLVDQLQVPDSVEGGTSELVAVEGVASPAQTLPPMGEMKAALMDNVEVSEESLNALASERAAAIKGYLLEQGVEENRVIVTAPKEGVAIGRVIELGVQ